MSGLSRIAWRRVAGIATACGLVVTMIGGASYLAVAGESHRSSEAAEASSVGVAGSGDDQPKRTALPTPSETPATRCDQHYPGLCIPPVSYNGDLDCDDLMADSFRVIPPDPHGFDEDNDGIACEPD